MLSACIKAKYLSVLLYPANGISTNLLWFLKGSIQSKAHHIHLLRHHRQSPRRSSGFPQRPGMKSTDGLRQGEVWRPSPSFVMIKRKSRTFLPSASKENASLKCQNHRQVKRSLQYVEGRAFLHLFVLCPMTLLNRRTKVVNQLVT